jgi:hypothetical protein
MERLILELHVLVAIAKTIVLDGKMVAAVAETVVVIMMVMEIEEDNQATV